MAIYNSPIISAVNPTYAHGEKGSVQCIRTTVTCSAAPSTADTINFFYLPPNARVVGAYLIASDMDTNGSPTITLNVGDAGSATRYFSASTVAQAGTASTALAQTGLDFITTAKTLITGVAQANAATGAAGTLTLGMLYVVEDSPTS